MNAECTRLSDRMPEVARGRAAWSAEDAGHLQGCQACAGEWRVVRAAVGLEQRVPPVAPAADIASAVLGRLRRDRTRSRRRLWLGGSLSGIAAAALSALLFWGGTAIDSPPTRGRDLATIPLPALDSLTADELQRVLDGIAAPITEMTTDVSAPDLGSLDSTELERVLDALEG